MPLAATISQNPMPKGQQVVVVTQRENLSLLKLQALGVQEAKTSLRYVETTASHHVYQMLQGPVLQRT